jgi:hypothetical protein
VLTLALYGLLAIAIMGALFLVAVNLLPAGEQIAPSVRDEAPWTLPLSRPLDATDVASIRLPVALRGYRFAETDALLDRLAEELRARDAELTQLRGAPVVDSFAQSAFARPDYRPSPFAPLEPRDFDEPPEPPAPPEQPEQPEPPASSEQLAPPVRPGLDQPASDDRPGEPDGA